ncbi:MAG: hypothetical protein GTO14_15430 [Anaerolineales bacterium]|nr:hypothetical protein [Anaerolineales bacterium]
MGKIAQYREVLASKDDWDSYLLEESGLPGARANLELAFAVAEEGDSALFERYRTFSPSEAPTNSPEEFLAFCGVLGLGTLLNQGELDQLDTLRKFASDPRWRIREAVVLALHRYGAGKSDELLLAMQPWIGGNLYERRAAIAAVCEPEILAQEEIVKQVLDILDSVTSLIRGLQDRRSDGFKTLRKGLGYCWSIAVEANPALGKPRMERWLSSDDRDVRWIMKTNLRKKRLSRMDEDWVEWCWTQIRDHNP